MTYTILGYTIKRRNTYISDGRKSSELFRDYFPVRSFKTKKAAQLELDKLRQRKKKLAGATVAYKLLEPFVSSIPDPVMTHALQTQAYDGSWHVIQEFEDKESAEKEMTHLNNLLINDEPYATLRIQTISD